jgi:hypothetical protein
MRLRGAARGAEPRSLTGVLRTSFAQCENSRE